MRRLAVFGFGAWLTCALVLGGCRAADRADRQIDAGVICTSCQACEETLQITSGLHVTGSIDYPDTPPAGGPHNSCWAQWGVHDDEVPPERWVHNLEHGGVVLLYHCDPDCAAERAQLTTFVQDHARTLLTSYPPMQQRFAVVAWGHRLTSDCLDLAAFDTFYRVHVDRAPESLADPPPSACALTPGN